MRLGIRSYRNTFKRKYSIGMWRVTENLLYEERITSGSFLPSNSNIHDDYVSLWISITMPFNNWLFVPALFAKYIVRLEMIVLLMLDTNTHTHEESIFFSIVPNVQFAFGIFSRSDGDDSFFLLFSYNGMASGMEMVENVLPNESKKMLLMFYNDISCLFCSLFIWKWHRTAIKTPSMFLFIYMGFSCT